MQLLVTTTNGVERQHEHLKYGYLADLSNGSLTDVVTVVVRNFIPACQRRLPSVYFTVINFFSDHSYLDLTSLLIGSDNDDYYYGVGCDVSRSHTYDEECYREVYRQ